METKELVNILARELEEALEENAKLRQDIQQTWEALMWHPDDPKEQLVGYIEDAQDILASWASPKKECDYDRDE